MTFDRDLIRQKAKSTVIPLLITNMNRVRSIACEYGEVDPEKAVMRVKMK